MRDKEYEYYLDTEELKVEEEDFDMEKNVVEWNGDAWVNRDEEAYGTVAMIPGCMVFKDECENTIADFGGIIGVQTPYSHHRDSDNPAGFRGPRPPCTGNRG